MLTRRALALLLGCLAVVAGSYAAGRASRPAAMTPTTAVRELAVKASGPRILAPAERTLVPKLAAATAADTATPKSVTATRTTSGVAPARATGTYSTAPAAPATSAPKVTSAPKTTSPPSTGGLSVTGGGSD